MWRWVARGVVVFFLLSGSPSLEAQGIGDIESPLGGTTVSGAVQVAGFAIAKEQISRLDLYIDGQLQYPINLTVPRIDIIEANPDYEGDHFRPAGFLTSFLASRFTNGPHTIFVRVLTADNKTFDIGNRTVIINNAINQLPLGNIDLPGGTGITDASGAFPVTGWALDVDGVDRVDVAIDDLNLQSAVYGANRPDVSNAFPDFPAALTSGFVANIDTTRVLEGIHTLTVRVTDRTGLSRVLGSRTIQIFNSTNNLRPFGFLDEPRRDAVLFGTSCSPTRPPLAGTTPGGRLTPVRGWALDLGTREDLGRVSYVELLIDGSRWLSSDDCEFDPRAGVYVNCYGVPRFDVQRFYPTFPDSPRSGFLFMLNVGSLMRQGVRPGNHVMKLRVGDQEQTFADIPNTSGIPVSFQCAEDNADFASIGFIDSPRFFDYVKGTVTFNGWALDENASGVRSVEIYIDGTLQGVAQYGLSRIDVQMAFPNIANSVNSGWSFTFDTTRISDARHRLSVRVLDSQNRATVIGSTDFFVDNPN